jgi:hypothetical protein
VGGVEIQPVDNAGLGVIATQDLKSNDLVIVVPTPLAITTTGDGGGTVEVVQDVLVDKSLLRQAPWYCQMSLYLNWIKQANVQSDGPDFKPWLAALPRSLTTPLHWSSSQRAQLQYHYMEESVTRQEEEWMRWYNLFKSNLRGGLQSLSWDDFVWGCEMARSRAFSSSYAGAPFNPFVYAFALLLVTAYVGLGFGTIEQAANGAALVVCASILKDFVLPKLSKRRRYVICPVLDMANHVSTAVSGTVSLEFFQNAYSLAITTPVASGDQVFISYGTRSNDQLLQYYGFCETDNPHDVYILPPLREWDIRSLERACGRFFAPGRLQKLERAGLLGIAAEEPTSSSGGFDNDETGNPRGGVVVTRAGGVDPAVLQALRIMVATDEEWNESGEAIGNFATPVSKENERLVRIAVKTALESELATKATTLEEDHALLLQQPSKSLTDEDRIAIQFRIEKKKLLAETVQNICIDG